MVPRHASLPDIHVTQAMGSWAAVNVERQRQLQQNQPANRVNQYQQLLAQQQHRQQQAQQQRAQQQQAQQQQAQSQWATASQQSASAMSRGQGLNRGRPGYQQAQTRAYNQGFMGQTQGQAQHQIAAVRREAHAYRQAQARAHAQHLVPTQAPNPLGRYPSESMTAAVAAAVAITGAHNLRPLMASPQLSAAAAVATSSATVPANATVPAFTSALSPGSATAAGSQSQMQGHIQSQAQG